MQQALRVDLLAESGQISLDVLQASIQQGRQQLHFLGLLTARAAQRFVLTGLKDEKDRHRTGQPSRQHGHDHHTQLEGVGGPVQPGPQAPGPTGPCHGRRLQPKASPVLTHTQQQSGRGTGKRDFRICNKLTTIRSCSLNDQPV